MSSHSARTESVVMLVSSLVGDQGAAGICEAVLLKATLRRLRACHLHQPGIQRGLDVRFAHMSAVSKSQAFPDRLGPQRPFTVEQPE